MFKRVLTFCVGILLLGNAGLMAQVDLTSAKEKIANEQYAEADNELKGFLTEKQKNADEIYYWRGMIQYRQEAYEKAKELFQMGLKANKKSPWNQAGMGLISMKENKLADANEFLTQAVANSKKSFDAKFAIAEAYLEGGNTEIAEAKKILYGTREDNPDDPRSYIYLGEYYKKQGVPELAMEELENAKAKDPNYVSAYVGLAELYYEAKDYQKGYQNANKAIELDAGFAPAYRIRGELFLISSAPNKFERARDDLQKYVELTDSDIRARIRYASFLFLTEDYDQVIKELEEIGKDTTTNLMRRLAGMSYNKVGKLDKAKASMQEYFNNVKEEYRIAEDYKVYADILRSENSLEKADENYMLAMQMDDEAFGSIFEDIADSYKKVATDGKREASKLKKDAREDKKRAIAFQTQYNDAVKAQNETEDNAEKARLGEEGKKLYASMEEELKKAEGKEAEAAKITAEANTNYPMEAHYRQKALEMADPVGLAHYQKLGIALYNAKEYDKSDAIFKEASKLSPEYLLPYTYRIRCAYYLEEQDKETNDWYAKAPAEDLVAVFGEKSPSELDTKQKEAMLIAYEVMATYNFNPTGEDGNYHCDDAKPWIDKILGIDPNYSRIKPIADYCNQ